MKYFIPLFALIFTFAGKRAQAQEKDSVVQLYGVVMTADSLRGLEGVSVVVSGKGRGTVTNGQGVFSIAALKGDIIIFSYVGFKDKEVIIPKNLEGREFSVIQLLVSDTNFLPGTVIRPRPSKEQFERDFLNSQVPADDYEIARSNTEEAKRRVLIASLPSDGKEAANFALRSTANKASYAGQLPPQNIMNPFAWAEFIKAWKRGDFKKKKK